MAGRSLYRLCLLKTAKLLKNSFRNNATVNEEVGSNPFCGFPTEVIHDLVDNVLNLAAKGCLKATAVCYLLTSGRVANFRLNLFPLNCEEFISILMSLSVACQNLQSLTLRDNFAPDNLKNFSENDVFMMKAVLERVLSICPLLKVIESCVEFDLKAIRNCDRLKVLKLHFVPKSTYYAFLKEIDGGYLSRNCLSVFEVFVENKKHTPPVAEISTVLKFCPNLTQVNIDISQILELLHGDQMFDGTLTSQYKLRKCCLGSIYSPEGAATLASVYIATVTCPLLEHIDILVHDNAVIYNLSKFQNLSSLFIHWAFLGRGDFQLGLLLLLESIGRNLKKLHLINFCNMDFAAIAANCPNIEDLKVDFHGESHGYSVPSECFKCLRTLHMEIFDNTCCCSESTLILLLSNATNLTRLYFAGKVPLTDYVLVNVFKKNSLSKLHSAIIFDSKLTKVGLGILIEHSKMLQNFSFYSPNVLNEDVRAIVHSINPRLIV